jgi:hypothetical protein
MGVVSVKELARKGVFEINKARQLTREWVVVLSDDTLAGNPVAEMAIGTEIPVDIGFAHPTYAGNAVRKITYTEGFEGSPYHVHVVAEYGVVLANELLHPVNNRKPIWEFDSTPGQVPALFYYEGAGNTPADRLPLTNSALDYFEGLVAEESLVTAKVTKNFGSLPTSWIAAQNFINSDSYLGCDPTTIKVAKVTVKQTSEDFGGSIIYYWQATAELQYRESGHNLQLPDVGFNFFQDGQKRRAMVFDFQNGEWVATTNPVGLNGNGEQTFEAPAILNRRINRQTNFLALFGTPPTSANY